VKTTYLETIRSIAEAQDVHYLLHFTQFSNLHEIVKYGLLSRKELEKPECKAHAHAIDPYRLDGREDAISVSISRVNRPVFAVKRHKSGHTDWVILGLSSEILWTHNCLFSWCNAAKKEIIDHKGWRGGPRAFIEMFGGSNQSRSGLVQGYPTDIEAEVQVLDPIAPDYIVGAIVDRPKMVEPVQAVLGCLPGEKRPVVVNAMHFD
jgi:hypothetical protein